MVRITSTGVAQHGVQYFEFAGLSTDSKPAAKNIMTGSLFHEVDTTKVYAFNEEAATGEEWIEQMALGGSGS